MTQGVVRTSGRMIAVTNYAWEDFRALLVIRFKLPAFAADRDAEGRASDVEELERGLRLHDLLIEKIARLSEARWEAQDKHGRIERLIVEEGPLRHQATVAVDALTIYVGGLSFTASGAAYPGFSVYPCLRDLRLADRCPYPMLARAG